jgi:hypothetical protein
VKYPIYIPSKGRAEHMTTHKTLLDGGVEDFMVVVEEPEVDAYAAAVGADRLVVLPHVGQGIAGSRNWIKQRAREAKSRRHWQIDDDVTAFYSPGRGGTIYEKCQAVEALTAAESFTDNYSNIAATGITSSQWARSKKGPVEINRMVYTVVLFDSLAPGEWRADTQEDTDYVLQLLSQQFCTVRVCAYAHSSVATDKMPGGCTDNEYLGDNRRKRILGLQRRWPGLGIEVQEKNGLARVNVSRVWRRFTQVPEKANG